MNTQIQSRAIKQSNVLYVIAPEAYKKAIKSLPEKGEEKEQKVQSVTIPIRRFMWSRFQPDIKLWQELPHEPDQSFEFTWINDEWQIQITTIIKPENAEILQVMMDEKWQIHLDMISKKSRE
jgi:hypothetical protein